MSLTSERLGEIKDKVDEQVQGHLTLFKLRFVERSSLTMGFLYTIILVTILVTFAFFFASVSLVYLINDYLDSKYWGFIIMSAFYVFSVLVISIICLLRRRPMFTDFFVRWFSKMMGVRDI